MWKDCSLMPVKLNTTRAVSMTQLKAVYTSLVLLQKEVLAPTSNRDPAWNSNCVYGYIKISSLLQSFRNSCLKLNKVSNDACHSRGLLHSSSTMTYDLWSTLVPCLRLLLTLYWRLHLWSCCNSKPLFWTRDANSPWLVPNSGTVFCPRIHQSWHKALQITLRRCVFCKDSKCVGNRGALERSNFSNTCSTTGLLTAARQVFVMLPYFAGTGHFIMHLL